jgi:hypothetical protein
MAGIASLAAWLGSCFVIEVWAGLTARLMRQIAVWSPIDGEPHAYRLVSGLPLIWTGETSVLGLWIGCVVGAGLVLVLPTTQRSRVRHIKRARPTAPESPRLSSWNEIGRTAAFLAACLVVGCGLTTPYWLAWCVWKLPGEPAARLKSIDDRLLPTLQHVIQMPFSRTTH